MSAKQLLFHNEVHAKILAGMGILANAVRATLGPKARTVVLAEELTDISKAMVSERSIEAANRR